MKSIKETIIKRDGMSSEEADDLIEQAIDDFNDMLMNEDDNAYNVCADWFGLEPDYIMELM